MRTENEKKSVQLEGLNCVCESREGTRGWEQTSCVKTLVGVNSLTRSRVRAETGTPLAFAPFFSLFFSPRFPPPLVHLTTPPTTQSSLAHYLEALCDSIQCHFFVCVGFFFSFFPFVLHFFCPYFLFFSSCTCTTPSRLSYIPLFVEKHCVIRCSMYTNFGVCWMFSSPFFRGVTFFCLVFAPTTLALPNEEDTSTAPDSSGYALTCVF